MSGHEPNWSRHIHLINTKRLPASHRRAGDGLMIHCVAVLNGDRANTRVCPYGIALEGGSALKSALLVWGGWPGHSPKECAEIFGPWLESQGYDVEVSDTLDAYLDADRLKELSLIVPIWTQGEITKEQETNLLAAVHSGVGISGWHGCMGDSFRMSTDYQFMVGGQWVSHPGGYGRLRGQHRRPGRPDHRRARRLQDVHRAVLHARRPQQRGAGDDHFHGRSAGQQHRALRVPLDRRVRDARRLEAHVGQGPGLLLVAGPQAGRLRRAPR